MRVALVQSCWTVAALPNQFDASSGFTLESVGCGVRFMTYFHSGDMRAGSMLFTLPPKLKGWRAKVVALVVVAS